VDGIPSALFVDFDNIFGALLAVDREAALLFAQEPWQWLAELRRSTSDDSNDGGRRFLQCRLYLNPAGWTADEELGNENGRLYFQRFRPAFTNAGFEVVDCPSLTARHKNAADIRMVVDVLASIETAVPFQELVLASGDADFTPLLQAVRARGKRITVLAAGEPAPAYLNVADTVIDFAQFLTSCCTASSPAVPDEPVHLDGSREEVEQLISDLLSEADGALLLPRMARAVRARYGRQIDQSNWFGHGGPSAFIRGMGNERFQTFGHYAWDATRYEGPDNAVPPLVRQLRAVTDLPAVPSGAWPHLFEALARRAAAGGDLDPSVLSALVRDELSTAGHPVAGSVVSLILGHIEAAGAPIDSIPPLSAEQIRSAFLGWIAGRCVSAGRPLVADDLAALSSWLSGSWSEDDQPDRTGSPGPAGGGPSVPEG